MIIDETINRRMSESYVYCYRTPVYVELSVVGLLPGAPFYVGKGKGNRYLSHLTERKRLNALKHAIIDRIRESGSEPEIEFLATGLTDSQAKDLEILTVAKYGRISTSNGTLANLTDGGDGSSGFVPSEETRKKWSAQRKNLPNPNKGVRRPGIGGRPKGTGWSEETRQKIMQIRSMPGYYDYTQSADRNRKISEAKKGCAGNATGKRWFNNGEIETYQFVCPYGYVPGRKSRDTNGKKGLVWYNNGIINRQFVMGTEEEGFRRGRVSKK